MTNPAVDEEQRLVGSDRVLAVLIELGNRPHGATLEDLAQAVRSPRSTVHRALSSLRRSGLAAQVGRGTYALGDEYFRLAFLNFSERPDTTRITPALQELSSRYQETAHYAVLDGAEVVYRAKTDPPGGAVRLTSVIGGRNPAYRTAVGKLLLSFRVNSPGELRALVGNGPLERRTPQTVTNVDDLWEELRTTRDRRYAVDDQENEMGVNCVAVPVFMDPGAEPTGAVSVSALAFRRPLSSLIEDVEEISLIAQRGPGSEAQ